MFGIGRLAVSLLRDRRGFIAALQNCVMKIGRMRFSRVKCDDHTLVFEIDFHVFHPENFLQHRSQLAHALIAIFAFGPDLDCFQDRVISPFGIEWIGWVRLVWSRGVHCFFINVRQARSGCL